MRDVQASLKSGSRLELKKCVSEIILAAIIDVWVDLSCVEEPQRRQAQYQRNNSGTYRYESNEAYSL